MDILEKHQEIYHYTTETGLQGILTSQNIRASHFRDLNDATELDYAKGAIEKIISDFLHQVIEKSMPNRASAIESDKKDITQWLYNSFGEDIYIISFCGYHYRHFDEEFIRCNGLLSQWRGYCKDEGYILVFNPQELTTKLEEHDKAKHFSTYIFDEAIYTDDDPNIQEYLERLKSFIRGFFAREFLERNPLAKYVSQPEIPQNDGNEIISVWFEMGLGHIYHSPIEMRI